MISILEEKVVEPPNPKIIASIKNNNKITMISIAKLLSVNISIVLVTRLLDISQYLSLTLLSLSVIWTALKVGVLIRDIYRGYKTKNNNYR